ncbi:MAG: FAD-dependent oxidoreductase [Bdellovibrionales bacterium]|nr:FAD-dependent oxidoreductase [Bdellovibrionales bacterium]
MIGTLDPNRKSVTIIGAGVSGLLAGYALKKQGYQVRIFEQSSRAGGLIETKTTLQGPAESAAHSLMVNPEVEAVLCDLGVEMYGVNPGSHARYIYRKGKMRRFPLTFFEAIQTLIRIFSKPARPIDPESASLAEWCRTYVGDAALKYLLAPFVTGVFAASPEELLLSAAFPRLVPEFPEKSLVGNFLSKRKSKSAPKAEPPRMMAPRFGMTDLIAKLRSKLATEIEYGRKLESLPDSNVVLAIPAPDLATLLDANDPMAARALREIEYSPLITCTVFIRSDSFTKNPPRGVGVLIPRDEGLRILGVLFNSSAFPERTKTPEMHSYTVMLGGTSDPKALELSDLQIREIIETELKTLFHLRAPSDAIEITRWKKAIPVYSGKVREAREALKRTLCSRPGTMVFTNYSKDVSIRGMILALKGF